MSTNYPNIYLVAFFVITISRTFFSVTSLALLLIFSLVRCGAGFLIGSLTFLLIFCSVSLLTNTLVGCVAFLLVVCLISCLIDCLTSLVIGHWAFWFIDGLIDCLVMSLIHCSAFWSISMAGKTQDHWSYHKLQIENNIIITDSLIVIEITDQNSDKQHDVNATGSLTSMLVFIYQSWTLLPVITITSEVSLVSVLSVCCHIMPPHNHPCPILVWSTYFEEKK